MEKTLKEIADFLGASIEGGAPDLVVRGVNGLEEATAEQISFAVPPHLEEAKLSKAGVIIIGREETFTGRPVLKVDNPRAAFARLLSIFRPADEIPHGISPYAFIDPTANIGKNVDILPFAYIAAGATIGDNTVIYPQVYIGNKAVIGANCVLYPNVTIREKCVVGERTILQSGAVIGGDGFGYITENGKHSKVPQKGNVVLGSDVEIGSNTCIDRAMVESTIVGSGTKIDNLVHLGHNDVLGENCLVVAQVGISGSVVAGHNCTFAGQVGTVGHIKIGDNCTFAGRSGITNNVPSNSVYAGFPARPHRDWLKNEASLRKVSEMQKKIKELTKALDALQKALKTVEK